MPKKTPQNAIKNGTNALDSTQRKKAVSTEYWCYPDEELNAILCKFWFEVQSGVTNENGEFEMYSISSLKSLRNGLTCELNNHGQMIDLTKDPRYKESQVCLKMRAKN